MTAPAAKPPIRAFIAIALGEEARRAAAKLARSLRERPHGEGVRWVPPQTLHATLRFLGLIDPEVVPKLVERVADGVRGLGTFEAHLAGVHALPSRRRPRVIALALAPREPLERLAAAVERGVVAAGFEPEPRPFRAHVTLGRVRARRIPDWEEGAELTAAPFPVREAILFRSELRRSGARYSPLERIGLGGSDHP